MLLTRTCLAAALVATTLLPAASASDLDWQPDLGPALELARAEGKDLLVDFTGSDWCGWCHRLDAEVFAQDEFAAYAEKNFVLVALDFPKEGGDVWNAMTPELRARNRKLQAAFGVTGFPSVLLMTPEGASYAKTGYRKDGAAPYIEFLTELRAGEDRAKVQSALKRFKGDADNARGERLAAAYELHGNVVSDLNAEIMSTVRLHDKADSHGLLAGQALGEWKDRHLGSREPDWTAMKADAAKLRVEMPSIENLAEFHMFLGFANALTDDIASAEFALARVEDLDDGNDRMITQMTANLKGLISAAKTRAEASAP